MPNLELTHDQLQELVNMLDKSKGMLSYDLTDAIMSAHQINYDALVTEILESISISVKSMLLSLLEPIAYKYKMSENTDIHFINFILSLEQHIDDFKDSMMNYEE